MGLFEEIIGRIRGAPPDAFAGLLSDQAQYGQPAAALPAQWPFGPNGAPSQVGMVAPDGPAGATDISARARSPASPAALAPEAAPASPVEPSMFGRLGGGIMSGLSDNSNALLAIGAGFAGAPNIGQAISRASAAVIPAHAADVKQRLTQQSQAYGTKALVEAGVPIQQAIAAQGDPDLKRALIQNYIVDRKGELKEIGVDSYGNKRFGVFDPFTRKIEPVNTGAGGVDNASAVDALVEAGVPRNLALAAQRSPDIMKSVTANYLNDRKGELKEIGVDRYGNKIMGVFDPFTKKITPVATGLEPTSPASGGGTVASAAPPAGGTTDVSSAARPPNSNPLTGPVTAENDITGPDYLERLKEADPAYARQVESVINGDAPFPTGRQAQTPLGRKIIQDILTVEPGSSASDFSTRQGVRKDYASGNASKVTKAVNTAITHGGGLEKAIADLHNFSVMPGVLNAATGMVKKQFDTTYQKARKEFETNAENYVRELDFAISGGRPTVSGAAHQRSAFDINASPEENMASLRKSIELLKGRLDSHAEGFNKGMRTQRDGVDFVDPPNRAVYKKLLGETAPAAASAAAPVAAPKPGRYVYDPATGKMVPAQ